MDKNHQRVDWWVAQTQHYLRGYLSAPSDRTLAPLNEILKQYREAAEARRFVPPTIS